MEMRQLSAEPDVRLVSPMPPYEFESPFGGQEFVLLLHSDDPDATPETRAAIAGQVVASGCRYVCCSGEDCSRWHDDVNFAFMSTDVNYQPPAERFIMTTWHEGESLSEVVWYVLMCTSFDDFVAERFLVVLLKPNPGRKSEVAAAVRSFPE